MHYLSRLFANHPFAATAALCLAALTFPLYRALDSLPREAQQTRTALLARIDLHAGILEAQLSRVIDGDPRSATLDGKVPLRMFLAAWLADQMDKLRHDANGQLGAFLAAANQRYGDTLSRVDRTLTLAEDLHTSAGSALNGLAATEKSFGLLADSYRELPDRLGYELRPSWLAIQPEITCRALDGSGYGGCWHSRVTALMGEAAGVGGIFRQKFPLFADSVNGIAMDAHGILDDAHAWTRKYVYPHPLTPKQKVQAVGKGILGLGVAGLRGGVF